MGHTALAPIPASILRSISRRVGCVEPLPASCNTFNSVCADKTNSPSR